MAGLLGVGQSALMAAYAQLQTTGHNIANANTPGYSRQEAQLATSGGRFSGGGFLGMGVDLVTVQRRYDRFLSAELAASTAAASADQARAEQLGRLDRLLADTDAGIGIAIDDLNAALADVANRPFDPSAREAVLRRADTLAQRLRDTDAQMLRIGAETDERIGQAVSDANQLIERYAALNERIAMQGGNGHTPNDLLDERDRVLLQINEHLKVTAHPQDDGGVNLYAAGGEGLVVGGRAAKLVAEPDPLDASRQRVVLEHGATRLPLDGASFGGGSLGGLTTFRGDDLAALRTRLARLAEGIAGAFNAQQALGVDANGSPGTDLFRYDDGIFTRVLPSGERLATACAVTAQVPTTNGGNVSVSAFEIQAADPDLADPVELRFTAPGIVERFDTVTGTSLGSVPYVENAAITFHGWSITLRGTPQVGDSIAIVPTANPAADNRNVKAMITLSDRPTVDGFAPGDPKATFGGAFAAMLAEVGTRTRSAQASEAASTSLLGNARAAQAEHSAVNLDEEAARLLQYQQMYQAAAKVIQTAQSMFDTLLSATAR